MPRFFLSLLFICSSVIVFSQEKIINGFISDENGKPIPFAHVLEVNSGENLACDVNGEFKLVDLPNISTIKVTAVGFKEVQREINLNLSNRTIKFILVEDNSLLNEHVISGTLELIKRKESPIPIAVYSAQYLNTVPAPSLVEATNQIAGLRPQFNCAVCNTGDIHINGMEGSYSMIVIDGMPIMGGLSTVYGLQGIPTSLIQQVEVIKGPASTIYGSEAMAGLINVVTKNVDCIPKLLFDFNFSSWGELQSSISFKVLDNERIKAFSAIDVFKYNNPIDNNGDYFTDLTLKNRYSIYNKIQLLPKKENHNPLTISFRYLNENRWGGQMNWTVNDRGSGDIYGESILTERFEFGSIYQLPFKEKINWQTSFSAHDQKSWYGLVNYDATQIIGFSQLTWHKNLQEKHNFLSGLALRYNFYDDNTPATFNANKWWLPGIFVQDNFKINSKNRLLLGWRTDYHTQHGVINSPRVNYKLDYTTNSSLRIGYGNGFRVVNVFTEDHSALTGAREVVFLEELKPEVSKNINISVNNNIKSSWANISLESSVFHSRFSNKIIPDFLTNDNQIIYKNLDGYSIAQGASTEITMKLNSIPLSVNFNTTILDVANFNLDEDQNWVKTTQFLAEKYSVKWGVNYSINRLGIDLNYAATVYGPIRLPLLENDYRPEYSSPYELHNLKITKNFNKGFKVFVGARNIFNFTPPDYSILRAHDPFDKLVNDPIDNPDGYSFDASYMYASFQGINFIFGGSFVF